MAVELEHLKNVALFQLLDDDELARRRAEGHVGLTALGGLVADAGGRLEIHGEPGVGTTLHAEVPVE